MLRLDVESRMNEYETVQRIGTVEESGFSKAPCRFAALRHPFSVNGGPFLDRPANLKRIPHALAARLSTVRNWWQGNETSRQL